MWAHVWDYSTFFIVLLPRLYCTLPELVRMFTMPAPESSKPMSMAEPPPKCTSNVLLVDLLKANTLPFFSINTV